MMSQLRLKQPTARVNPNETKKQTNNNNIMTEKLIKPFEGITTTDPINYESASSSNNKFETKNSTDFGMYFNSNGSAFPTHTATGAFLSKDSAIPSMDDIFRSKDSFAGKMYAGDAWKIDFTRPSTTYMNNGDEEQEDESKDKKMMSWTATNTETAPTAVALAAAVAAAAGTSTNQNVNVNKKSPSGADTSFKSSDWEAAGTLGTYVALPSGYTPAKMGWGPGTETASVDGLSQISNVQESVDTADWFNDEFLNKMGLPKGSLALSPPRNVVEQRVPIGDVDIAPPQPEATGLKQHPAVAQQSKVPAVVNVPPKAKRKRKRAPRKKVVPAFKEYVEPQLDIDVLMGRGGRSNHNDGNKRYRAEVEHLRPWYNELTDKDAKTDLSSCLVEFVHNYGGRFLELDKEVNKWYIVPDIAARRKVSQALREDTDPEKRRAKRQRFIAKRDRLRAEAAAAAATTTVTKSG